LPILTCPGCGRGGLRIPDGRRGNVTCPTCGAEWFYPERIELSEVEFRCAQSGARFVVQLSRRSPLHKFVVQGIKNAPPPPGKSTQGTMSAAPTAAMESGHPSPQRLSGPGPGRWLANLFGNAAPVPPSRSGAVADSKVSQTPAPISHDANQYNWASFFCPYCNATNFVQCAGGHFACDGSIEVRSGRRFHQCFCGNAGFIEGTIKTIQSNSSILPVESDEAKAPLRQTAAIARLAATSVELPIKPRPQARNNCSSLGRNRKS
jgi:transcription elongation factor Elf1